jgi:membrane-associated protein
MAMMGLVHYLFQLHGLALLGALCLVLFVEECGVPMPFAPGDLLLALAGLAIRDGRLHPLVAVAAIYVSSVAGALLGRELFALLGARLLRRLTRSGRLSGPLDRAARLLRRGGWPAVLMARLVPGLRVHTTEVAGLLGLPRWTFATGLVPAAGVYIGVFVGAGALLGRPAVTLLLHAVHKLGAGVVVVAVILLWVGGIWLAGRLLSHRAPGSQGGHA